jgi:iron(III) transport system ATP-binding protein
MILNKIEDNNLSTIPYALKLENIFHKYEKVNSLRDISFHINKGEIVSILGPSGCGKSTLLRIIAGIEQIHEGQIFIDGVQVANKNLHTPPEKREVGLVFQDLALFPHLSIFKNIEYGLLKLKSTEKKSRISEMLSLVKMEEYSDKYPHLLSGGQQQRIALARAIAPLPKILLLDEPFSGLDMALRKNLCFEVKNILKKSHMTSLFVTHDATEALMFSDKIIILNEGKVEQFDTPETIYNQPQNPIVASFFGTLNKIKFNSIYKQKHNLFKTIPLNFLENNSKIYIYFRPEAISLTNHNEPNGISFLVKVTAVQYYGAYVLATLYCDSFGHIIGNFNFHEKIFIGKSIEISLNQDMLFFFSE